MKLLTTDLLGKRFGTLTVIAFDKSFKGDGYWLCKCDCGQITSVRRSAIIGQNKSCGCLRHVLGAAANTTHGASKTKEYRRYNQMKRRCYLKADNRYKNYGGRGIKVCDRWLESYENFLADMGKAPSPKHSIDRIDNDGNYEPINCRWATVQEQMNNRTTSRFLTLNDKTMTLAQWSRFIGRTPHTISDRIKRGLPLCEALKR